MPEAPECKRVSDELRDRYLNKTIVLIEKIKDKRYYGGAWFNSKITKIYSYGKRIIFDLEDNISGKKSYLSTFLGMHGKLLFEEGKNNGVTIGLGYVHGKVHITEEELYFDIYGTGGWIKHTSSLDDIIGKMGPCVLNSQIPKGTWMNRLKKFRKEIGSVLIDDKFVAGIGNYLRAEILYECKIDPFRKVKDLTDNEIENMRTVSHRIVRDSYKSGGLTIQSYISPSGKKGTYNKLIYGSTHDPLGNQVIKKALPKGSDRMIHYVPEVQK